MCGSLIADLGDAYCEQLRRTAIGPFEVAAADPETVIPLAQALEFLPEVRVGPEQARRAGHGMRVPADAGTIPAGVVRLTGEDGLIALAEPREDGLELKPVVGFSPPLATVSAHRREAELALERHQRDTSLPASAAVHLRRDPSL